MSSSLFQAQKTFLDANFLLHNEVAESLYHNHVRDLPVIDFHNHLDPAHLSANKTFDDLSELWIKNDPYKHRAMRICGVPEEFISGAASNKAAFMAWVETIPYTVGNPLFHWSYMELKKVFGLDAMITPDNAEEIWEYCNSRLKDEGFGMIDLIKRWNVETVCTSDDLLADLDHHRSASRKYPPFTVVPSLRADTVVFPSDGYISKVSGASGKSIGSVSDYKDAVAQLLDRFDHEQCRFADIALDAGFSFNGVDEALATAAFSAIVNGKVVTEDERGALGHYLMFFIASECARRKWILQLHIGAQRNTSTRLRTLSGPAGGYACIGNSCDIKSLVSMLDHLEQRDSLPRVILYTLNPTDNEALASITGSFSADGVAGKIQLGPAWWYNDHYEGIRDHLKILAGYGLLRTFIGMTTDSRSALSLSRHDYFRRILCNLIGEWVSLGELPNDPWLLEQLVKDVSYQNIKNLFSEK